MNGIMGFVPGNIYRARKKPDPLFINILDAENGDAL